MAKVRKYKQIWVRQAAVAMWQAGVNLDYVNQYVDDSFWPTYEEIAERITPRSYRYKAGDINPCRVLPRSVDAAITREVRKFRRLFDALLYEEHTLVKRMIDSKLATRVKQL